MASKPETALQSDLPARQDFVEMPRPTVAPLVLSLGMVLMAAGAVLGLSFLIVGRGHGHGPESSGSRP